MIVALTFARTHRRIFSKHQNMHSGEQFADVPAKNDSDMKARTKYKQKAILQQYNQKHPLVERGNLVFMCAKVATH